MVRRVFVVAIFVCHRLIAGLDVETNKFRSSVEQNDQIRTNFIQRLIAHFMPL